MLKSFQGFGHAENTVSQTFLITGVSFLVKYEPRVAYGKRKIIIGKIELHIIFGGDLKFCNSGRGSCVDTIF